MSITGEPGRGPIARGHPHRRPLCGPLRRARHPDRAFRGGNPRAVANGCRPRSFRHRSSWLDFQAARWLTERRGRGDRRATTHPTTIPHRRLRHRRRLHEHRRRRRGDLAALRQIARPRRLDRGRALQDFFSPPRPLLKNRDALKRRDRRYHRDETHRLLDRDPDRSRRACGRDQRHLTGLRQSAGPPPSASPSPSPARNGARPNWWARPILMSRTFQPHRRPAAHRGPAHRRYPDRDRLFRRRDRRDESLRRHLTTPRDSDHDRQDPHREVGRDRLASSSNQPEKRNAVSLEMWEAVEAAATRARG